MSNDSFSLIVPTYNSHKDLERLLSSVLLVKDELVQLEIIVVDDGSYDDTPMVVRCFGEKCKGLRYVPQKNKGPGAARNEGARHARGEYLIFVDDDCVLPQGLLGAISDFYKQHTVFAGVGVKTVNSSPSLFSEFNQRLGDFLIGSSHISDDRYGYVSSRCYSFSKQAFWSLQGHDEGFIWPAAEDRDLCFRLKKAGMALGYLQKPAVVNTDRLSLKGFIRQNFYYGLGAGLLRQKNPDMAQAGVSFYKDLVSGVCKGPHIFRNLSLFFAFCLAQICSLAGVISFKMNFDNKRRPPSVFLPRYAVLMEIIKNHLLGIPLIKSLKRRSGSLTTGEELLSEGYLAHLAQRTADVYKDAIFKTFQDERWLEGKKILEIGPGSHLGIPLYFIAAHAAKVVSIDKYGEVKFRAKEQAVYEKILTSLSGSQEGKLVDLIKEINSGNLSDPGFSINYFPDICIDSPDCTERLPCGSFDLIVSYNTMEHCRGLACAFRNMRMLLKEGGIFIHKVDATSHYAISRYTKNSLSQLVLPDRSFEAMFSHRDAPTRRLLDDYLRTAQEQGIPITQFFVDESATTHEMNSTIGFLDHRFKSYGHQQLSKVGFIIVARK